MKSFKFLILSVIVGMFAGALSVHAQTLVKVSGVVTSAEDGLPMMGVGVMAGAGSGVITSLDGDYVIDVAPGTELTFSSIGFEEQKVVVPSVAEFTHNVVLQPESLKLDDVVVIA